VNQISKGFMKLKSALRSTSSSASSSASGAGSPGEKCNTNSNTITSSPKLKKAVSFPSALLPVEEQKEGKKNKSKLTLLREQWKLERRLRKRSTQDYLVSIEEKEEVKVKPKNQNPSTMSLSMENTVFPQRKQKNFLLVK
jgi:hypothetical protein